MVMVLLSPLSPLKRWWQTTFGPGAELTFVAAGASFEASQSRTMASSLPVARAPLSVVRHAATPLTAARNPALSARPAKPAARRFWMTLDPKDLRHAALGGSFAEVCSALEQLAAVEEHRAV